MADIKNIFLILKKNLNFLIYIIIGLLTNFISLSIFIIKFEYLNSSFIEAQILSSTIATTLNYFLNCKFTFKNKKFIDIKKIFKYLVGLVFTFFLMRFIFMYFYNNLIFNGFFSYFIALSITSLGFFFWQKLLVFKFTKKNKYL